MTSTPIVSSRWHRVPPNVPIEPRCGASMSLLGDPLDSNAFHGILVCFGQSSNTASDRTFFADAHAMSLANRGWRTLNTSAPIDSIAGRAEHAACVTGDNFDDVLFFGAAPCWRTLNVAWFLHQ
jgi:hypothetical protein